MSLKKPNYSVPLTIVVILISAALLWYSSLKEVNKPGPLNDILHKEIPFDSVLKLDPILSQRVKELALKNSKIPLKALETLVYVREFNHAPPSFQGGKPFYNREKRLPIKSKNNKFIKYKEWDVHPLVRGKNRGAERLVTSKKSAYYTRDHYDTFTRIKE